MRLLYSTAAVFLFAFIIVEHFDSGSTESDPADYGTMSESLKEELDETWCTECRLKQQKGMKIACGGCPGGSSSGAAMDMSGPGPDDESDGAPKKMSGRGMSRPKSDKKMGGRSLRKSPSWCKSCLAKQRKGFKIGCDGCSRFGKLDDEEVSNDDFCFQCKAKQRKGFKIACPDCDDDFCTLCRAKQAKGFKIACPRCS